MAVPLALSMMIMCAKITMPGSITTGLSAYIMGQSIQVASTTVGDVVIFDTDRSITGQDGVVFTSADEAAAAEEFPAQLASRIFAADSRIDHVYVASNQVVVRRPGGWDDAVRDQVDAVVSDFFLFYPEA